MSCTQFRTVLLIILPAQTSVPEEETELDTRGDLGKYILTATAVKHSLVHNLLTYTSGTLARNTRKLQSKHNYFYFYLMSQNPNHCRFQTLGEGKILLLLRIKLLLRFFFWYAKITKQKKWKKKVRAHDDPACVNVGQLRTWLRCVRPPRAPTVSVHIPDGMTDGLLGICPRPRIRASVSSWTARGVMAVQDVTIHAISQGLLIGLWWTDCSVDNISC